MKDIRIWEATAPLPTGRTLLIEASAGTGKTWQMASLVGRLVAEHDLPIHEILVITFTNAAAAELRDRVRRRLVEARDALERDVAPSEDPVLAHLWNAEDRDKRRSRLATALTDFDRAPISTIHGFCQRTLDQLAFESGQEPGLELLADPGALRDELVDDTLARMFVQVGDERQLGVLASMGLDREGLASLVKEMTEAVAPELVPPPLDGDDGDPVRVLARWQGAVESFAKWLNEGEGKRAYEAVLAELRKSKGKRFDGRKLRINNLEKDVANLRKWLEAGAPATRKTDDMNKVFNYQNLFLSRYEAVWKDADDVEGRDGFEGRAFFAGCQDFFERQEIVAGQARAAFAARARRWLHTELERRAVLTYDTMLSRLSERLGRSDEGPEGPLACAIRDRYEAALIDEFQDTDGAQWNVLQTVFVHHGHRLVMVGDPKQAIYGFRGADVHVYLEAAKSPGTECHTMDLNWRSDRPYVDAMNCFWPVGEEAFCREDVPYVEVGAKKDGRLFEMPAVEPPGRVPRPRRPLELRWLDGEARDDPGRPISNKDDGEALAAMDSAREAAVLLRSAARIAGSDGAATRPIHPGDIAVLVRTNQQAERVRQALAEWKIPSVSGGRGSVFVSPAAGWVAAFLDAVAEPGRDGPARVLATTPLFGWTAAQLARSLAAAGREGNEPALRGDDDPPTPDWAGWIERVARWASMWRKHGFAYVFEQALDDSGALGGLLASPDGERHATDLRHIVELCHTEERRARLAPQTLAAWLRDHAARAGSKGYQAGDEEARRLESDARSVQVVTVHKSKGLEYPIVLLPFAWATKAPSDRGQPLRYHDDERGSRLCLDVHPKHSSSRDQALVRVARESIEEDARLLYVALTRAAHHCVAWLGPIGRDLKDRPDLPAIGRLALRKVPAGEAGKDTPATRLGALEREADGLIGWAPVVPPEETFPVALETEDADAMQVRRWTSGRKTLDSAWQVASFSSIVAGRAFDQDEPVRAEEERLQGPDRPGTDEDEPVAGATASVAEPRDVRDERLLDDAPLAQLLGGPDVGTWVHAVLEHLDFATGQPWGEGSLDGLIRNEALRAGVRDESLYDTVRDAIPGVLDTPLDGGATALPEGFRLRDIPLSERLDELAFQMRLGHGNRYVRATAAGKVDPRAVRVALEARDQPWPGSAWMQQLLARFDALGSGDDAGVDKVFPAIAGIMTGFVDLTFRVPANDPATARYYVVDYKTNRIAAAIDRRASKRIHYTQPWLAWAMAHGGYHLQSLVYTLALHRLLSQRLGPRYDYDVHIGGHLYLFVRGMEGGNPARDEGLALGVYADRWPGKVTVGLDRALDGASPREVAAAMEGWEP